MTSTKPLAALFLVSCSGSSDGTLTTPEDTAELAEEVGSCSGPLEARYELIRETGKPQTLSFDLDASTDRCITVEAGWAADGPEDEAVPAPAAAKINIDGERAFGPDNFNGTTWSRSWEISATGVIHSVEAEIDSAPGTGLRLWVHSVAVATDDTDDTDDTGSTSVVSVGAAIAHLQYGEISVTIEDPLAVDEYVNDGAGITIELTADGLDENPYGEDVLGVGFDLQPEGAVFKPTMVATIRWPEGKLTDEEAAEVRAYLRDSSTGEWEPAPVVERSIEGRYIKVAVRHHSLLSLALPFIGSAISSYYGYMSSSYARNVVDLEYGSDEGENPYSDFGDNNTNFVSQSVGAGFLNYETADDGFSLRSIFKNAKDAIYSWFYVSDFDYSDSWEDPAAFDDMLQADYVESAGVTYKKIECDTIYDYLDYTQIQEGDLITGDFPPDFIPDPAYIPDGIVDMVFLVGEVDADLPGYNEIRLWYQDTDGHADVGLGTINDEFYKRAIFCAWRPDDMIPPGDTEGADPEPVTESPYPQAPFETTPEGEDGEYPTQCVGGRFSHGYPLNYGIDYVFPIGTEILAVRKGTVEYVHNGCENNTVACEKDNPDNPATCSCFHGIGNVVVLKHADEDYTLYAHLNLDSIKVSPGEEVCAGKVLAESGHSGFGSAAHLHFQYQSTPGGDVILKSGYISKEFDGWYSPDGALQPMCGTLKSYNDPLEECP